MTGRFAASNLRAMRKLALSTAAAALMLAAVPATAAPGRAEVLVKDNFFKPDRVVIRKGGLVVWRWRGSNPHNVAIKRPGSSTVAKRSATKTEGSYRSRFRRVGKWRVLCEIHPLNMTMRVIVRRS